MGIEAVPVVCDMSDLDSIPAMVEQVIAACGPIDILVNNAGTSWGAPTIEHPLDGWDKVITLNLTAIFVASQEVGRRCMVPRKQGKVINIASVQGLSGGYPEGMPTLAYNASKGGVVNMTRMLANEWAAHNINVNAIAPGYFESKMTKHIFETQRRQDRRDRAAEAHRRPGGPERRDGAARIGCVRLHHRPDHRRRRRIDRSVLTGSSSWRRLHRSIPSPCGAIWCRRWKRAATRSPTRR